MLLLLFIVLTFLPLANLLPLDGQNKGCAHDGKEVDVGETLVVGCDTCTCIPGKYDVFLVRVTPGQCTLMYILWV